jgi:uncharacterized membrane protein YfcA
VTGEVYFAGLTLGAVVFACTAVFLAALVRGYSGFGLSALIVTSLALVIPPVEVVPMAMALEVVASIAMLRRVWRDVSWRETGLLLIAAAIGTPFGLWLLTTLSADIMRVVISLIVLSACLGIWFGIRVRGLESRGALAGTGLISGLAQGAAAVGGLPLVLYFLSVSAPAVAIRATLIVYLLIVGAFSFTVASFNDLVTVEMVMRGALLSLPLVIGNALGNHRFLKASPDSFRRFALVLLIGLSLIVLLRSIA